jgi:hypothetical protein
MASPADATTNTTRANAAEVDIDIRHLIQDVLFKHLKNIFAISLFYNGYASGFTTLKRILSNNSPFSSTKE